MVRRRSKVMSQVSCDFKEEIPQILGMGQEHPRWSQWREHSLSCPHCSEWFNLDLSLRVSFQALRESPLPDFTIPIPTRVWGHKPSLTRRLLPALGWSLTGLIIGLLIGRWWGKGLQEENFATSEELYALSEVIGGDGIEMLVDLIERGE